MTSRLAAWLLALSVAGCAKAPPALPPIPHFDPLQQLHDTITAATRTAGVQRAAWGIVVHSLDRDERLFELNPGTLLVPASAAKLVAVATAVDAVGWNYQYETTVRATGPIVDGVLQGDLVVIGSGDPTIGGRGGEDLTTWTNAIASAGIRRVEGRVIGDDDAIDEPRPQLAWAWDDLGYTTGAIFGALNFGENRMTVTVTPAMFPGAPTTLTVEPYAAYRPLTNRTVTLGPTLRPFVYPEQRPGEPFLTIAGYLPAGGEPVRVGVSAGNPTFWFATVLRNRLQRAGIEVAGEAWDVDDAMPAPAKEGGTVVYRHRSRPLSEIVQPLLKESINLYGEAAMRLNVAPGAFPTNDNAIEGMRMRLDAWGIPRDAWQVIDGSGLSRRNTIAADAMVTILRRMFDATGMSPWMRALPIAGVDGTLENRMKGTPAENNVRAKTGTMSNIRALAGYVRTRDGENLAFAIMADNFEGTGATATEAIDRIAVALASFSRNP